MGGAKEHRALAQGRRSEDSYAAGSLLSIHLYVGSEDWTLGGQASVSWQQVPLLPAQDFFC